MTLGWLGAIIGALGLFLSALGKVLFRAAVVQQRKWLYAVGFVSTCFISPLLWATAYGLVSATVLASMSGLIVAFNVILSHHLLQEALTVQRVLSVFLIIAGTILSSFFGAHTDEGLSRQEYIDLFKRPQACGYYAMLIVWYAICLALIFTSRTPFRRATWLALLSGSCAGNVFTEKAGVEMLKCVLFPGNANCGNTSPLSDWFVWVLGFGTLAWHGGGLLLLALALHDVPALFAITLYEGTVIVTGAMSASIVLNEAVEQTPLALLLYAWGMVLVLLGLGLLGYWPCEASCQGERECSAKLLFSWGRRTVVPNSSAGSERASVPKKGERTRLVVP